MNKGSALGGAAFVLAAGLVAQQLVGPSDPQPETPAARGASRAALEAKVQDLEARLAKLERAAEREPPPPLTGPAPAQRPEPAPDSDSASSPPAEVESLLPQSSAEDSAATASPTQPVVIKTVLAAVDERINAAVGEKLEEIKQKWNKKPQLETVAKLLELDERQRRVVEEEVREGQVKIRAILEQPTADGTSLLDELVEVMVRAQTPEAGALWGRWLGRLQTEKVPGTNLTYAARLEEAKAGVREGFRRVMSAEQYSEFEEWAFDPTEVEGIRESPWSDFGQRVAARAAELAQQRQE